MKKLTLTTKEKDWFDKFIETDEFAEALGIAWRCGSYRHTQYVFSIRHIDKNIVDKFAELVPQTSPVSSYYRKDKDYIQHECNMNLKHPFVLKMQEMGWAPHSEKDRVYPVGEFNEDVFVKSYIRLHYDLGTSKGNSKGKTLTRARLRIHGSGDVLEHICSVLHKGIGVGKKKLQTDTKVKRAKIIYYQSKKEIPKILEYIGETEALQQFRSFNLGYQDQTRKAETHVI